MQKTQLKTYANHVRSALVNRREALQIELAVMFAVTLDCDGNKRLAREAIYSVWDSTASYQCAKPGDRDWKSVGRSINAAFALWDFTTRETVDQWADGKKHGDLISSFAHHIAEYKLATVNEVLTICEKVKAPTSRVARPENAPKGSHVIDSEHIHVVAKPGTTADELMQVINELMQYANELLDKKGATVAKKAA